MTVKKLLIIQQDDAYFLHETFQVLEKNSAAFKDYELTVLVDQTALSSLTQGLAPIVRGITTNSVLALKQKFDISVNLSLRETSWDLHGLVDSGHKIGPHRASESELNVEGLWSTYLLTIKAKAPFLTFHLQDIYKHILGIKAFAPKTPATVTPVRQIAYGTFHPDFFGGEEQERFLSEISRSFPHLTIRDVSEFDFVDDLNGTLYVGPATLQALRLCEAGATGVFAGSGFHGFNLLPYSANYQLLSTRGRKLTSTPLLLFIEGELTGKPHHQEFSLYRVTHDEMACAYLDSNTVTDDSYPFYQSHVVLWNFLLNLSDVGLEVLRCTDSQKALLRDNQQVVSKLLRLHDYALAAVDHVMNQSKSGAADAVKISAEMKTLEEFDRIAHQIAGSHQFLRPLLDFYRIRRAQPSGPTLLDQSQSTFLTYAEEHKALAALEELFSVTLRKNEATI